MRPNPVQLNPRLVFSADWYSDLNATVAASRAAGGSGVVRLSKNTTYAASDPVLLYSGLMIEGEDWRTSLVVGSGAAVFQMADPGTTCENVRIRGVRLSSSGCPVAIDARGMIDCLFEQIYTTNFSDAHILIGGNESDGYTQGGWSNTFRQGRLSVGAGQTGFRIAGVTSGGSNVGNNILIDRFVVNCASDASTIGIDLVDGDTALITGCDVGYGDDAIAFRLGANARFNRLIGNRSESTEKVVRLLAGASRNEIIANHFDQPGGATLSAIELANGAQSNTLLANTFGLTDVTPHVSDLNSAGLNVVANAQTRWKLPGMDIQTYSLFEGDSGATVVRTKRRDQTYNAFELGVSGRINWKNVSTDAVVNYLGVSSTTTGRMDWMDDGRVAIPKATSLPTAASALRGVMFRLEGGAGVADGVWICVKDAADAYSWKQVTLA